MWRIIATLCLTAVAEFTPEQLDKMSSSIQTTADQLQDKVVSLSKEINPLTLKVSTAPAQMLGKSDEEKAEMIKDLKATITKVCGIVDSMRKVQAEKLKDEPKMQQYLSKFQKAIGTLDSAATSAATYTTTSMCETKDEAASRLYLQMAPVSSVKFHIPSALLGALGAAVLGAALVIFRTKSARSPLALMEEGTLE